MFLRLLTVVVPGLLSLVLHLPRVVGAAEPPFVVAGYLPDYRLADRPSGVGPLTDVQYFGLGVPPTAEFTGEAIPQPHLETLRRMTRESGCRVLLTIGGWGKSAGFPKLAADPAKRRRFVLAARAFCREHGFAGIDYDWEHPEGADQVAAYRTLLRETHAAFAPAGLLVTIAQAGWQRLGLAAYESVDRVHLMAYDHAFPQATFEKAVADVEALIDDGCPWNKIVLGVPFYGRNAAGDALTYGQIVARHAPRPETDLVAGYAFNGPETIARKLAYAKQQRLGGVMIWEIGQDAPAPGSLLAAIEAALAPEVTP